MFLGEFMSSLLSLIQPSFSLTEMKLVELNGGRKQLGMLQKLIITGAELIGQMLSLWHTMLPCLWITFLCFSPLWLSITPSEESWRRREKRRAGSWAWSGRRDQMAQKTWRERDGLFSCRCVRWGHCASPNTRYRHLSHTWGGLDFAHMGGLPCGFHIPSRGNCTILLWSLLCLSRYFYKKEMLL